MLVSILLLLLLLLLLLNLLIGIAYGLWVILSMAAACFRLKERAQHSNHMLPPSGFVPIFYNTFQNRAFSSFLIAWVLDNTSLCFTTSMFYYFVRYVIKPGIHYYYYYYYYNNNNNNNYNYNNYNYNNYYYYHHYYNYYYQNFKQ